MMNKLDNNAKDKQTATLTPKAVFGIRNDIPQNIQYFSSDKCAYVAGNYVIICSVKEKQQYFYPANSDLGEITCFGIDELKDTIILAVAQKIDNKAIITIKFINKAESSLPADEHKTKKVTLDDMDQGDYFMSLNVNVSKLYIVALSGPKTTAVTLFQYELRNATIKCQPIRLTNPTIYRHVYINPYNPYFLSVLGDGGFALITINDVDKKTPTKLEIDPRTPNYQEFASFIFNFVSCTWISKTRIALLNSSCDVFVIDYSRRMDNPIKKGIKSVAIFDTQSKGKAIFHKTGNLYIAKDDGIIVKLEDKQQSEKIMSYEKPSTGAKFVTNLPRMEVHSISLSNQNTQTPTSSILISTESNQLYYIDIQNDNSLGDGNNYKFLLSPFHSEDITCLDVSRLKQLVATCSRDRYIRIWNYINLQLENSEMFEEEPIYVAFHPNGLHLAVLFREKFRLMNILEKSISVYREFPIFQPTDVKFSNFGHLFSICYKSSFSIYNFYTCESIFSSKNLDGIGHSAEITSLVWDQDDVGFATCGADGRAFYWSLYSKEKENCLVEYHDRDSKFSGIGIYSLKKENEDTKSKTLLLINEHKLVEVTNINKDSNINDNNNVKMEKIQSKILLKDDNFTQLIYDQDTYLLITASSKENTAAIRVAKYPGIADPKDFTSYQANSSGIKSLKTTFDMTHLFTCGRDKCLFFFQINNISKSDKRDEILETDLILVKKEDLDKEAYELRTKLSVIDHDIQRENETFDKIKGELDNDKKVNETLLNNEKARFLKERNELDSKIKNQKEYFEDELHKLRSEHEENMHDLAEEQEKNKFAKDKDREKENENYKNEVAKDEKQARQLEKKLQAELSTMVGGFEKKIIELNNEIRTLEEKKKDLNKDLENIKEDLMEKNDNDIRHKRGELEKLRNDYERLDQKFNIQKKKKQDKFFAKKEEIKQQEKKKHKERGELSSLQLENDRLTKQIRELSNDRKEKEQTIVEKNSIKRELEKENQELEKFKFVLNYKIKELKHEKDPKENKLQTLEKQAKDMDREIKNFEFAQANYIINLSTNHEIMKLYERQIGDTEKRIEKLKNYKKLFQESLYNAMKRAKNHKDLKKELVTLKRLFLDKESIEMVEKPYESNYESQRQFLENNITDFKGKIDNTQRIFTQDHNKLMRENMNLISLVNELEREKKDIESQPFDSYATTNKSTNLMQPKTSIKASLPMFNTGSSSLEQKAYDLKKEIYEIEKELQMIKMEGKHKKDKKKELKEKK